VTREILCLIPLIVCVAAAVSSSPLSAQEHSQLASIPANIHLTANARAAFVESMDLSTTVRRQAAVIRGAGHVQVVIRVTMPRASGSRARTTMVKRSGGSMLAEVEIPAGSEFAELVAHEFEHILEQIEGLDLSVLVRDPAAGVREVQPGVYETRRAATAERAVRHERLTGWDPAAASIGSAVRAVPNRTWRALRSALRTVGTLARQSR
jgi:hypothetical protein